MYYGIEDINIKQPVVTHNKIYINLNNR
jgi:hypothetical protein